MMAEQGRITGQVAALLDEYSLVINRGEDAGVEVGMVFTIMGMGGDIIDPETKQPLGPKPVEKLRVKVTEVFDKYSVAETYRIVPPSMGPLMADWRTSPILSTFGTPQRQKLANQPPPRPPENPVVKVEVGDVVRELKQ